ncbi:MAG: SMC-Scp complex subunit ScpB [Nitrospira sp.]|jgi:segregation and condensation protein B|uniref:SMC-Scp complex subunit ScpB n=1 Tax=Nitrospira sp. ND1 TaxID=1658518 RepID=UPI0009CECF63|nr:SMC-Scp complex subunit ScpB [Nitrospira sp. ND1]MBP8102688.1 SMC-Scp complex subunit ScpB [Nitrospira sp.]MBP8199250.1 SMC-Scp complex subunit ScpB [Nitrospira sp.]MBP8826384.1 SMC-Scp complex subunit ScpB [Nitrospira sp.]SLM43079.1 putative chromosome segregation and condensation protein B [Nitrospira sp. ND1]
MEEPMSPGVEEAIEESIEVRDPVDEPTASLDAVEVVPESGKGVVHDMAAPAADSALSDMRALKGILEALLFVTAEPIPVTRFLALLGAVTKQDVDQALASLAQDYEQEGRGLQLAEVAGGYRIVTKAEFAPWLKRLEKVKSPSKLSRSALESLAIIAYKQPIVRAEVEQIRGVETSGVIRTLLERKLVRIVGRKEEPGRPIMYGTTKFFLEHFGLRDLSQLPPLREFKELGESEQAMLPIDEVVAVDGEPVTQSTEAVVEGLSEGMDEPVALLEPADEAGQTSESLVLENEAGGDLVVADIAEES